MSLKQPTGWNIGVRFILLEILFHLPMKSAEL
jgi:hypothetical protein